MDRKTKGIQGEQLAEHYLLQQGFEILERNYQEGKAEIDLIGLLQNSLLVFVEVKYRKHSRFGDPETFVSDEQKNRITQLADQYIHDINWQGDIRFDIIAIDSSDLAHFPDAFH